VCCILCLAAGDVCKPECRWQCDDPSCPALCHPVCNPPECEVECIEGPCAECEIQCEPPDCGMRCPADACEKQDCPIKCETICSKPKCEAACKPPIPDCRPVCAQTMCKVECIRPDSCPRPTCELVCEKSNCTVGQALWEADEDDNPHCCPCNEINIISAMLDADEHHASESSVQEYQAVTDNSESDGSSVVDPNDPNCEKNKESDEDSTTTEEETDDEQAEKQIIKDEGDDDYDDEQKKKEKTEVVSTPLEVNPQQQQVAVEDNVDTPEEERDEDEEKTEHIPQQPKGMTIPRMVNALPPRPAQPYPSSASLFKIDTQDQTVPKPTLIEIMHTLAHRAKTTGGRNDMCCPCSSIKRDLEAEKKNIGRETKTTGRSKERTRKETKSP